MDTPSNQLSGLRAIDALCCLVLSHLVWSRLCVGEFCGVLDRKEKADSTRRSSRAVPHPSTNRALRRLTSEVRRDPVYSTRYGRQQQCWEERRSATLRRGNLPRRRERHRDMSTLLNCAPQNKLGAASSGGDPPTRCAERSSAGARAQKGPNPTACGSGRESTTPLSPAAPGPAALS